MNDNTKWKRFDVNDKTSWPKKSGEYFIAEQYDDGEKICQLVNTAYWFNGYFSSDPTGMEDSYYYMPIENETIVAYMILEKPSFPEELMD